MGAGRPLKFKDKQELEDKISKYFSDTKREEWTITGLAIALDTSRETLCNYEDKEEYFDTIKKAKDFVEYSYEIDLKKSGRTGTIFALKNFNWKDKTEQEIDHKGLNIQFAEVFKKDEIIK
jgi:hypothetical protein